jgi:hypothetical protein
MPAPKQQSKAQPKGEKSAPQGKAGSKDLKSAASKAGKDEAAGRQGKAKAEKH